MLMQILPFWMKYWYYILIGVLSFFVFDLIKWLRRDKREGKEKEGQNPDDIANQDEEAAEDPCDEEFIRPTLPEDLKHIPFEFEKLDREVMVKRASEFYNAIATRRSLRFFSSDPVPKEAIREIIRAAGTSPSGAHLEPWTFVVISNGAVKSQIRDIVEQEEKINYLKRMGKKWTTELRPLKTDWIKEYLTDAPYLILVFKQSYRILPNGTRKVHYYPEISVSIACGILITAIQFAGLVTLTSTPLNCGLAIRTLLKRPSNEKLVLLLPVGYPAEDATVPDLRRKSLSEILVEVD